MLLFVLLQCRGFRSFINFHFVRAQACTLSKTVFTRIPLFSLTLLYDYRLPTSVTVRFNNPNPVQLSVLYKVYNTVCNIIITHGGNPERIMFGTVSVMTMLYVLCTRLEINIIIDTRLSKFHLPLSVSELCTECTVVNYLAVIVSTLSILYEPFFRRPRRGREDLTISSYVLLLILTINITVVLL